MLPIIYPIAIMAVIGIAAGVILTIASRLFYVPVDERFDMIRSVLPGANCGACGYAGCDEYARQLVTGEAKVNLCTPGGEEVVREISSLLGCAVEEIVPMYAIVRCCGTSAHTGTIMDYQGPKTCEGCNYLYQGSRKCSHGCLGYGDCVEVCQYDAISIIDGVAVVDPLTCTGCGMCAKRCPDHLISIIPQNSRVYVGCLSTDRGAFVRKLCSAGCIGCKKCEKTCQYGAIIIDHNLAAVDPEKCTNCGSCIPVCPTGVIRATCRLQDAVAQ